MGKFEQAMAESGDLIQRLRESAGDPNPIRCLLRDMWFARHNVPYMATMYEANQEMVSPLRMNGKGH